MRPGFRVVLALERGQLVGFCYGASTIATLELEPWYAAVTDAPGPGVTDAALTEAFELADLGVIPTARDGSLAGSKVLQASISMLGPERRLVDERAAVTKGRQWHHRSIMPPPSQAIPRR